MKKNYFSEKTEFVLELFFKQKYILLLVTLTLFIGNSTIAQTTITITTTGASTWTVPPGVSGSITVEAWGAGGSGGGATGKDKGGSGGTGGTYVSSTFTGVTSGTIYNLSIAPSTSGNSAANGTNGQGTWFNTSATLFANGGLGGLVGNGAARTAVTTGSIGTTITAGGSSSAGTASLGSAGGAGGNGGGAGGLSVGAAGSNSFINGNPGTIAGGGGSGSTVGGGSCGCSSTGGTGAQGQIKITYTCPANAGTLSGTQTICLGDTTTFSSTVLGGTWSSSNIGIATINSSTGVITTVSAGGPVTMTYTLASGSCTTRTATRTLTVNALSVAPTSITGTTSICFGGSTTLTLNGGTAGTGAIAEWFSGSCGGTSAGTGNSITVSPSGNTTYFVRYNGTCNTTSCASISVTVNPLPVLSAITGATSVCIGSTTALSNSTSGGSWNSDSTGVATINASGVVSGISAGTSLITYTYTNANTCTSTVNTTITVNALPIVSASGSVCIGSTIQLTPNSGGTWTSSDSTKATVDNTGLVNGVAVGSVTFTYTNSTTNCSKTTNTVNVLALPAIASGPTATQTICSGSSVSFSVSATGTGLTYQWYNGATSLNNGGAISGATSPTLTINPVSLTNASANYNCVVSGTCSPTAPSANAELIVIEKVTITSQPVATQTLCSGDIATFAIAATGTGITFQWYKGASALNDGGSISGATSDTLSISPLVIGDAAANYYCLVSGTSPCGALASSNSNLNVNQSATVIGQPATTQTVCESSSVSFSVSAIATGLTYQWYNGVTALSNGGNISGATSATLIINPVSLTDASANYKCIVSGTCSSTATSTNAELIVIEKVRITSQPIATQTLCTGDTATITVVATGAGISYQWYKGATMLTDGGSISGATTNSLTITSLAISDVASNYYCLVSGTNPCSALASSNSNLNVNQSPSVTGQPLTTQTVCPNGTVSFSITGSGGSLVYQWYKGATLLSNGGTISGATSATLTINPVAVNDAASDYNCVVSNGCVGTDTSNNAALVVSPIAVIPAQSLSTCSQSGFSFTPVDGIPTASTIVPANTVYSWSAPSITGGITGGAALSGQTAITGTLNNPTNTNQTATYTVTPTSGISPSCPGSSFTVTVTVTPKPSIQNAVTTICTNGTFTVTPTNGSGNVIPSGTLYSWGLPSVTGGITGATIGSNQTSIIQTLTNPTTAVQTATYTITPLSGSCSGATFTLTVTVNPNPVTSVNLTTQTICSAVSFSPIIVTNTNNLATTYTWTRDNTTNVSGTTSGTSALIASGSSFSLSQILTNNTPTTTQNVIFTFTPTSSSGCVGSPITATVVVNIKAVIPAQSLSTCSQSGFSFTPVDGVPTASTIVPANTVYSWSAPSVTGGITGGAALSGQTAVTGALNNPTNTNQTATYTVTPSSGISPSCPGSSFTVTVTVTPKPSIQNAVTTICTNGTFTVTPTNGSGNVIPSATLYSWGLPSVTGGITGATIGSNQTSIIQTLTNPTTAVQTATYTITPISGSCSGATFTLTVTVNPNPVTAVNLTSQTICSAASFSPIIVTNTNNLATTYTWTRDNTTNVSGTTSGTSALIAAGSSFSLSQILTNNTPTTTQNVIFTFTPTSSSGCVGSPITSTVIVSIKAVIPAQSLSTCSQSGFSFTPVNGIPTASTIVPANTVYSWSAPSVTGGITGGAALSGQTAITGTLNNPTNTNQTATYTVTPSSGISPSCPGSSFTVTVTVTPKPSIQNAVTTICTNGTFTVTPTNGSGNVIPSGTLYSWGLPSVTGGITGATIGSNQTSIIQTLTNPTTAVQTATYTITPLSGSCSGATFTLTVTVNPNPVTSVNLITQTACPGISFSPIIVTNTNNLATTYTWSRDNTTNVSGATSGTSAVITAGSSFSLSQILTNNTATSQTVIYTFTPTSNGCAGNTVTSSVVVTPSSVGGTVSSSMPGVTPVVRTITECHFATGTVYLSGHVGNIVRWESSINGGATWLPIANTSTSYTYTNITQSTLFRAVIQNGSGCILAYSLVTMVNVIPNIKPSPVTATPQTICVGDSSTIFSQSGFATNGYIATGGTFSNANPPNWLVDGCGNCLNAGGSNTNDSAFQLSATNGGTYAGIDYAAVGKFAIACGNFNSIMQTPIFNTFGLPSATLNFNHAFNLQAGASVSVELSLDGGATYSIVLVQYSGPSTRSPYNAFPLESIDLSNYIGLANLRVRFVYNGNANSSWVIDDVLIPEAPSNLTTELVDTTTGQIISNTGTGVVSPIVTTTYAITSHLNGCTSFGPEGTTYITVTVNQRPTANIGPSQTICNGGTATFSVALTGVAPWSITYSNGTTSTTVNNINTNPYIFSVTGVTVNQTYTITALSDSKCTSKPQDLTGSAVVTVLNGVVGLWTGLVSNDWFDCKNWAGGLPSATVNAQIPSGVSRMPIIDPFTSPFAAFYSGIASAQDIIIANTASVTMTTNSNLYVSRDWKNSGTFTPGQGTVTFNSSTLNQVQAINLGIKTNETFYNLTVNNSNSAKGISVVDGFQLTVTNNLSLLSGDLRLVGEAQLVQNGTAANPSSGTGKILIDQQGNRSSYHYNYWTSPVTTNGTSYNLSGVLKDGTDSATNPFNPSAITFGDGAYFADGAITTPVKISNRWLYKYTSVSTVYAGWQFVGNTGAINPAEGFTMKGVTGIAPFTTPQNYVFVGKPNNGIIPLSISLNQSYLVGNPYPSALDADEFIKDNVKDGPGRAATNIFNGALYFWDHFGGQTHILNQYIGGYASYTLMGGVVAISNDPLINANGSMGTKAPKRYIPVAQGFFIGTGSNSALTGNNPGLSTAVTGGTINFKNSQRTFKVESPANSVFFKSNNQNLTVSDSIDTRQKIRLLYQSPSNIYRQILVGVDENTTSYFDIGYDAPIIDENAEDLYWNNIDAKLTIQAVSNFNQDQILPLGLKTATAGICTIKVDTLENISDDTQLYIHDSETGTDYDIKNGDFTISLPIGIYMDRFSLRFSGTTLGTNNLNDATTFAMISNNTIRVQSSELIKEISVYDISGKLINTYKLNDYKNQFSSAFNYANGVYIAKITLENGLLVTKKLLN